MQCNADRMDVLGKRDQRDEDVDWLFYKGPDEGKSEKYLDRIVLKLTRLIDLI
jgi:hypothetical protein